MTLDTSGEVPPVFPANRLLRKLSVIGGNGFMKTAGCTELFDAKRVVGRIENVEKAGRAAAPDRYIGSAVAVEINRRNSVGYGTELHAE